MLGPSHPFNLKTFLSYSFTILKSSLPTSIATAAVFLKDTVSLHYVGSDEENMAALGFTLAWLDAFGVAVVFGIIAGYGTINS